MKRADAALKKGDCILDIPGCGMLPATLGPELRSDSYCCPGYTMRINDDLRKAVAFIGSLGGEQFSPCGTGFLVRHDDFIYFVTAKHIAIGLEETPFCVRFNSKSGDPTYIQFDPLKQTWRWFFHTDSSVDVAMLQITFSLNAANGTLDIRIIPSDLFCGPDVAAEKIGPGDPIQTVGLFRHFSGVDSNFPIVHSGNIAAMPSDELIPVDDWDGGRERKKIEAYLVEQQSLAGLSGSPVFVVPTIVISGLPSKGGNVDFAVNDSKFFVLGLWQGSWEGWPDDVLQRELRPGVRVPVGIGIVVPVQKIKEVLNMPKAKEDRERCRKILEEEGLPKLDSFVNEEDGDAVLARMLKSPPRPHK